jgi:hypothetical protein
MLIITPKELIKTLQNYKEDEPLLVTWWSTEDVEMLIDDADIETDKAKEIWSDIIDELDNKTSDHVISYVNDEMDTMVYEKMEGK